MANPTTLNLDDDSAFLRGIEYADAAVVEAFIASIRKMREANSYSNQDVDKRMDARINLTALRMIGNTPIKTGV
jgi:hypothetical protein